MKKPHIGGVPAAAVQGEGRKIRILGTTPPRSSNDSRLLDALPDRFLAFTADIPAPLEVEGKDLHPVRTDDGVELLLTRYQGGEKGPVVLSHCIGVSSRM